MITKKSLDIKIFFLDLFDMVNPFILQLWSWHDLISIYYHITSNNIIWLFDYLIAIHVVACFGPNVHMQHVLI